MWRRRRRLIDQCGSGVVHRNRFRFRIERRGIGIRFRKAGSIRFWIGWRIWIGHDVRRSSWNSSHMHHRRRCGKRTLEHIFWDGTLRPSALLLSRIRCQRSAFMERHLDASTRLSAILPATRGGPQAPTRMRASRARGPAAGEPSIPSAGQKRYKARAR